MKALFLTNKRFLCDKNSVAKCHRCNMPVFLSMYEGHYVYLVMNRVHDFFQSSDLYQEANTAGHSRKYCMKCVKQYSRIRYIEKYLDEFLNQKDETAKISKQFLMIN
tara:strand:+ start:170 stop:490 length:321 start_codon:yes stop_codon:yes gene_type:complete